MSKIYVPLCEAWVTVSIKLLNKKKFEQKRNQKYFEKMVQFGEYAANYPEYLNNTLFLGFPTDDLIQMAVLMKSI